MKYIFKEVDGGFGFKVDDIHTILDTDIPISDELYKQIISEQYSENSIKLININGSTFEEMFEVIPPPSVIEIDEPIDEEKLAMAEAIADLYERLAILEGGV